MPQHAAHRISAFEGTKRSGVREESKSPLLGELKRRKRLPVELKRRWRASFWLLPPSVAGVMLFFVTPFTVVIYYAVTSKRIRGKFVGLENFRQLFQNNAENAKETVSSKR